MWFVDIVIPSVASSNTTYVTNEQTPVTLRCSATGVPIPSITWFKNGTPIPNNASRITISNNDSQLFSDTMLYGLTQELTINDTIDSDSSTYSCTANNSAGSNTAVFELIVRRKSTGTSWDCTLVIMCHSPFSPCS